MKADFAVSNDGIASAFEFIAESILKLNCDISFAHRLSVILDELCSNMIRHDETLTEESNFSVELHCLENSVSMQVRDAGQAFNALEYTQTEVPDIGGQGVNLIRGLASQASYSREAGQNVVTVSIDLKE